jgi:ribosome modulation factor
MDKQVSHVNKSDGRDDWYYDHVEGKEAYRYGIELDECPYYGVSQQEWCQGWNEAKDESDVD